MKNVKSFCRLSFILALSALFYSCYDMGAYFLNWDSDGVDKRVPSIKLLGGNNLPDTAVLDTFSFIVITDTHFGSEKKSHDCDSRFIEKLDEMFQNQDESLRPRFIVCNGDVSDSGRVWQYDLYNEFCSKIKTVAYDRLGVQDFKIYTVAGNHDLYNHGFDNWKRNVYPYEPAYRFSVNDFTFYFVDTANGTLGYDQLKEFESLIADDSNYKICFTHYPFYAGGQFLFTIQNTMERNRVLTDFARNNFRLVFEGHTHIDARYDFGVFSERLIPSYLYDEKFCFVTINSKTGTWKAETLSY